MLYHALASPGWGCGGGCIHIEEGGFPKAPLETVFAGEVAPPKPHDKEP